MAQQPLERRKALLRLRELRGIEIDRVSITPKLRRSVLKRDGGTREFVGELGELGIDAAHARKLRDRRIQCIERTALTGERLGGLVRTARKSLGMLKPRQALLKLLILTGLGINVANTLVGKAGLLKATPLRTARLLDARELSSRLLGGGEGRAIRLERGGDARARPRVDHIDVGRCVEQALVLMLAAQVDQRADPLGKLSNARHSTIHASAGATVGAHAALGHKALLVMRPREQAALDQGALAPLAHRGGIRALTH